MQKKTLTLKSISRNTKPAPPDAQTAPFLVVAGRNNKDPMQKSCNAALERLSEHVQAHRKVFIQMRNGVGYCGMPTHLHDGWLSMTDVSIYGMKQIVVSKEILIQLKDGSFIAHLNSVEQATNEGVERD